VAGTPASSRAGTGIQETLLDAKGDLIAASAADTAARVAVGTTGRPLLADAAAAAGVAWLPLELDYVQRTTNLSVTATTAAAADTCITANAVVFDGATIVTIEFYTGRARTPAANAVHLVMNLWDGATDIGRIAQLENPAGANPFSAPVHVVRRLTPSAASHTYSVRCWVASSGTGTVEGGAGGVDTMSPSFLRISRVAA
jgi:hypothetical protein